MKKSTSNFLATAFDWLGEAFEKFNPSAFRFLAAALPYLTPFPIAWLTSHSSEQYLHFTPTIAFIFVFSLEGIGLWFTSLLVDAVVDVIRSKNQKAVLIVIVLGLAVTAYIYILVSLNVTLESVNGIIDPTYAKVVTILCFLPLITGIGNGYYKLQLKTNTIADESIIYERNKEEIIRKEKLDLSLAKYKIKHGAGTSETTSGSPRVPKVFQNTSGSSSKMGRPSTHQARVFSYMDEIYGSTGVAPTFTKLSQELQLPQSTASRLRKEWISKKGMNNE